MARTIVKEVAPRFEDFMFDWYYERYLLVGGYGSGKSYQVAFKIVLKLLQEKRRALIIRQVSDTHRESTYELFTEILEDMGILVDSSATKKERHGKVVRFTGSLNFVFPNGSKIIFKGMDSTEKVKSIQNISIVWIEEASEVLYAGYKELLGRLRTPKWSMHIIMTCNPVGKENWVYRHFFKRILDDGEEVTILDDELLYEKRTIVKNGTYYHHSLPDDNPFLPRAYLHRLDEMKSFDYSLWRIARQGRFGANGTRVLPQFVVASDAKRFREQVKSIPRQFHFIGMDFGFEESYNAVVRMAVDDKNKILYLYDEIYINHVTDDKMANLPEMQRLMDSMIVADNEDPKAIKFYQQSGYKMRGCRNKFAGSRLSNTRKIKRFRQIVCSPKCAACIRELKDLTYKKDAKGNVIYDEFDIDPHTFSAIWYGLDTYHVADMKDIKNNSRAG